MSKTQKPTWTIMVYLAGDNDLTSHCVSILQQLEAVDYRDDVCVLACFESSSPWPRGSRYIEINCPHSQHKRKEDGFDWQLHDDLIPPEEAGQNKIDLGDKSSTRPIVAEGLRKFINWSVENHDDSEHYMLILFGHGPIVAGQSFLVSENPGSFLRLEDLKGVLDDHFGLRKKKLDIMAFQNCVMNGIETAYEIRHHVDYVVGSQGLVLASGWPYDKMIEAVVRSRSDAEPENIANKMLKSCARHMLDFTIMDRSSEQALCNLKKLREAKGITGAVQGLVAALIAGLEVGFLNEEEKGKEERFLVYPAIVDAIRLARLDAQSYWWEMFVDLYDFCDRLLHKCDDLVKNRDRVLKDMGLDKKARAELATTGEVLTATAIVEGCIAVMNEIEKLVPNGNSYYIGSGLQYSHGLSIYFPWSKPVGPYFPKLASDRKHYRLETAFATYRKYSFVKDSEWGCFLDVFFKNTLRNMRRTNRRFEMRQNLATFEEGMVFARYDNAAPVPGTSDLQKSSPDTARADFDMSFSIKNYPRRDYLSPADDKRRMDGKKTGDFKKTAPPVSPFGWNFPKLLAEVIAKPKRRRKRQVETNGSKAASVNPDRDGDSPNPFERVAPRKSSNGQPKGAGNPLRKVAAPRRDTD